MMCVNVAHLSNTRQDHSATRFWDAGGAACGRCLPPTMQYSYNLPPTLAEGFHLNAPPTGSLACAGALLDTARALALGRDVVCCAVALTRGVHHSLKNVGAVAPRCSLPTGPRACAMVPPRTRDQMARQFGPRFHTVAGSGTMFGPQNFNRGGAPAWSRSRPTWTGYLARRGAVVFQIRFLHWNSERTLRRAAHGVFPPDPAARPSRVPQPVSISPSRHPHARRTSHTRRRETGASEFQFQ